ncbi:hypothetical protein [Vibrio pectenicida]|uniref:Uncharacterized protein n=1 Tax=Vibrio pectenicida TaxID=62763 RepID=A0A3R9EFQ4_9VIBR|nr:hypothetical protein [Vibrio pectenicida]RSD32788.1 hypothetical protein EJA03_01520 [Vibrio pectenicida]
MCNYDGSTIIANSTPEQITTDELMVVKGRKLVRLANSKLGPIFRIKNNNNLENIKLKIAELKKSASENDQEGLKNELNSIQKRDFCWIQSVNA